MPAENPPVPPPNLALFREKITAARRPTGHLQKELADTLGLDPQVFSRKLHGLKQAYLTHAEVKQIIKTLVSWDALTTRSEVCELLHTMGLKAENFSEQEWKSAPLQHLENHNPPPVEQKSLSSLPSLPNSLIGREEEVEILRQQLQQPRIRLLTLLGTGGVGKTRLALDLARVAQEDFADGVYFVPLADLHDAALVPSTLAHTFHLLDPLSPDISTGQGSASHQDMLKAFLREKKVLLVLDNVEHLLDAAPLLSDLLTCAPGMKILATSRAVLHVYGEHEFVVPPLAVGSASLPLEQAVRTPAIRLFLERVQAIHPAFQLTATNLHIVTRLCASLDGLPLAIELAAARTRTFGLSELLARLESGTTRRLYFLRQQTHGVPSRQHTLRRTLDWSYDLLTPAQQRLFARLSVFHGGWTQQAIAAIMQQQDQQGTPDELFEQMEALVNQSLVVHALSIPSPYQEHLEARFTLLETIRDYAFERLQERGEQETVQQCHAAYYLALVEEVEPTLIGNKPLEAVSMLVQEEDNLRAALQWAIKNHQAEFVQRLCGALGLFWETRHQFEVARRWINTALAMGQEMVVPVRAKLLLTSGRLATWEGHHEQAVACVREAIVLYKACADPLGEARAMFQLGDGYHMRGALAKARSYLEKSLSLSRDLGDWYTYAIALSRLGATLLLQGELSQGKTYLVEAEQLLRLHGDPDWLALTLDYLGVSHALQGEIELCIRYVREGLRSLQQTGHRFVLATNLSIFGLALGELKGPFYAAMLCSAAETLFEHISVRLPDAYRPLYDARLTMLQSQADEQNWQEWWKQGKTLSQQEMIALALTASEPGAVSSSVDVV